MANISGDSDFAIGQEIKKGKIFPSGENRRAISQQDRALLHNAPNL